MLYITKISSYESYLRKSGDGIKISNFDIHVYQKIDHSSYSKSQNARFMKIKCNLCKNTITVSLYVYNSLC